MKRSKWGKWSAVRWSKWSEVKWSEVMILGEMYLLSLIYSSVAVCMFCAVPCVIIICFYLLFFNYSTCVFLTFFCVCFLVLYICCLFVYSVLCIVLCIVSPSVYRCLVPIFVQVYWPLPPAGNPIAVNKYHISSYLLYTVLPSIFWSSS